MSGEASHAYLITGPRSIGKHTLALRVAQTLNCAPRSAGGCGTCVQCRKIEHGTHPDVREIARLSDENRRDISIEQTREMRRDVALRPLEGQHRVVIVDDASELSDAAQDSVLKTLEEPPANATLILVTASPDRVLPTVASRCQPLPLRPVTANAIAAFLEARGTPAEDARAIAALAGGRPGVAARLASDAEARAERAGSLDELFALVGMRLLDRFAWAYRASEGARSQDERAALEDKLRLWIELLRDAAVPATASRAHPDRAERSARLGALVGRSQTLTLASFLATLRDDLARNSNVRAALELLALRLPYHAEFAAAA